MYKSPSRTKVIFRTPILLLISDTGINLTPPFEVFKQNWINSLHLYEFTVFFSFIASDLINKDKETKIPYLLLIECKYISVNQQILLFLNVYSVWKNQLVSILFKYRIRIVSDWMISLLTKKQLTTKYIL